VLQEAGTVGVSGWGVDPGASYSGLLRGVWDTGEGSMSRNVGSGPGALPHLAKWLGEGQKDSNIGPGITTPVVKVK